MNNFFLPALQMCQLCMHHSVAMFCVLVCGIWGSCSVVQSGSQLKIDHPYWIYLFLGFSRQIVEAHRPAEGDQLHPSSYVTFVIYI